MRLIAIFFILIALFSVKVDSQNGSIAGLITDADSKNPINGASINISGNKGDNSDIFGMFSIPIVNPGQYELIVSHIGYKTEILPVVVKSNLNSKIKITLKKADLDLSEVRISSKKAIGLNNISAIDIKLRPVNTSQDVLRIVPGLFIAQHAGGGKAEQIFIRGYDCDHGTDIAVTVDGIPVNMVSHAHGQGYADLHFLIPETVEKINFDKGPYFAEKGNLATAAYIDFSTKDFLETNSIKAEIGQFNTQRIVGLLKLLNKTTATNRQQFYVAAEYSTTDGYFQKPQDFHRLNLMGKYNVWFGNQTELSIIASTFYSKWNASGQIPSRAVTEGIIDRFGSIDSMEGGNTNRTNINIRFYKKWKNNWKSTDQFYFTHYKFNLFSDFTFFLVDSINGDMINQKESRNIFGYNTSATNSYLIGNKKFTSTVGGGFRFDNITGLELNKATRITFFNSLQKGDVKELNSFLYINQDIELTNKINLNAGIRFDHFIFKYKDILSGATDFASQQKGIVSPKLNISYSPNSKMKFYLNNGIGFHSNDTRVILNNQAKDILPKVIGTDVGLIAKPSKNLILKVTLWHLFSQQEFVYEGDDGMVVPSGRTRRLGMDFSLRYQLAKWLFADADLNFAKARAIDAKKGEDYVPLAPSFSSTGGFTATAMKGLKASIRYRLIDSRPANETNSLQAAGYFLLDAVVAYKIHKLEFSLSCENLSNSKWREAQFFTTSRLKTDTMPVSDIDFTPGTPRYIKASVSFNF